MTTPEQMRSALAPTVAQVSIAGVPWPLYKLVALAIGLVTLLVVGLVTGSAAPAVLTGAAAATVVWVACGIRWQRN